MPPAYAAGIVYFAVLPAVASNDVRAALVNGAAMGGWPADLGWRIVLTPVTAACGLLTVRLAS
jgi:hypothetical protein